MRTLRLSILLLFVCVNGGFAADDGIMCVTGTKDGKKLLWGNSQGEVELYDVATNRVEVTFTGHAGYVSAVAFSPDRSLMATSSTDFFKKTYELKLWSVTKRKRLFKLAGHTNRIRGLGFSPDGKTLASCSLDDTIRLWDTESGKQKAILKGEADYFVVFSPDGSTLATACGDNVALWDVKTERVTGSLKTGKSDTTSQHCLAFSPDGSLVAGACFDDDMRVWNAKTEKLEKTLKGHKTAVYSLLFKDGKTLVSGDRNCIVKVWDLTTGKEKNSWAANNHRTPEPLNFLVFLSGGKVLMTAGYQKTANHWNFESGERVGPEHE